MSYTASKLLEIAAAEIGYHEKSSNSSLDDKTANSGSANYTKYARDLAEAGYYQSSKQGYAWCDMFVDWCFLQLCGSRDAAEEMTCQTGVYGAGCEWSAKYYKQQDRFYSTPEVGDQVFFNSYAHTGIVEKIASGKIQTIEGNTSDQVARRSYTIGSASIDGYGRPKYDADTTSSSTESASTSASTSTSAGSAISVGDVVSIVSGATYYSGKSIPSWVMAVNWIVSEISGDRAVIDKSQDGAYSICSPINVKYLTVVSSNTGSTTTDKTVEELAQEVIAGKWGNGTERKEALEAAGYDYRAVQDAVNTLLA